MDRNPVYDVSAIIPTINGGDSLYDAVRSLFDEAACRIEVIVVDNASRAGALDRVKADFPDVKFVVNAANLGFAGGCNSGYRFASGKYVLLFNDDAVLEPGALAEMLAFAENHSNVAVVGGKITKKGNVLQLDAGYSLLTRLGLADHIGWEREHTMQLGGTRDVFSVKGACMLIRRAALNEAKLFDDDYFAYFEETDLCWRLWLRGWRTVFLDVVVCRHAVGATTTKFPSWNADYHSFKNRLASNVRNFSTPSLFLALPAQIGLCAVGSTLFAIQGKPKNALAILRAMFWNIGHMKSNMQRRAEIQKTRSISDRELLTRVGSHFDAARLVDMARVYLKRW